MIYEVITTDQADADLRGIYEYIAFELLSPDNAKGQLDRLEEHIIRLAEFPEKFRLYEKEPWRSRGLRAGMLMTSLITTRRCKTKNSTSAKAYEM